MQWFDRPLAKRRRRRRLGGWGRRGLARRVATCVCVVLGVSSATIGSFCRVLVAMLLVWYVDPLGWWGCLGSVWMEVIPGTVRGE